MAAVERPGLVELDQRSPPASLRCFSLSVSRSPSACHKVAACVLEIAIRIRVSRSTDDLESLVPRNVMRMLPCFHLCRPPAPWRRRYRRCALLDRTGGLFKAGTKRRFEGRTGLRVMAIRLAA